MLKNKKPAFITIIFAFIVVCFPLFSDNIYRGYDLTFHLNRIVGLRDAFLDHQFLPKIYPLSNNGFGYASPLFYCDLYLYPFALLYLLGLPLIISYKLMICFYVLLTIILVFLATYKITNKTVVSCVTTVSYVSCNYYLFDIYARAALGEIFALCFIPLVIYSVYKLLILKQDNYIELGISFSLLLMSHLISFALYCGMFAVFLIAFLIKEKDKTIKKKTLIIILKAVCIALLLTSWYLLPMVEQLLSQKFWVNELSTLYDVNSTTQSISSILKVFISVDRRSSTYGNNGIFNILGMGIVLLVVSLLHLKGKRNIYISICEILTTFLLLVIIGVVPVANIFNFIQFKYRLYLIIYPLCVLLAVYGLIEFNVKIQYSMLIIMMVFIILNVRNLNLSIIKSDSVLYNYETREKIFDFTSLRGKKDYNEKELGGAEYLPVTLYTDYLYEESFLKILNENYEMENYFYDMERNFSKFYFYLNLDQEKIIMLPISYYKGYQVYKVGESVEKVDTFSVDDYKQVGFVASVGDYEYICKYEGTIIQKSSLLISVISLIMVVVKRFRNGKETI